MFRHSDTFGSMFSVELGRNNRSGELFMHSPKPGLVNRWQIRLDLRLVKAAWEASGESRGSRGAHGSMSLLVTASFKCGAALAGITQ